MNTKAGNRTRWLPALRGVVALTLIGCSSPSAPVVRRGVSVVSNDAHVRVTNHGVRPVVATAFGRAALAIINWGPCSDPVICPTIAPGETRELEYPIPFLGKDEHEAVVYWWHLTRGSDGALRPDSVRAIVVQL